MVAIPTPAGFRHGLWFYPAPHTLFGEPCTEAELRAYLESTMKIGNIGGGTPRDEDDNWGEVAERDAKYHRSAP